MANKQSKKEEHIVVITITGESARDLIAVGETDLLNYFLPQKLGMQPKDCKVSMEKRVENKKALFGFDRYTYKK
jgi:hypothetical protein